MELSRSYELENVVSGVHPLRAAEPTCTFKVTMVRLYRTLLVCFPAIVQQTERDRSQPPGAVPRCRVRVSGRIPVHQYNRLEQTDLCEKQAAAASPSCVFDSGVGYKRVESKLLYLIHSSSSSAHTQSPRPAAQTSMSRSRERKESSHSAAHKLAPQHDRPRHHKVHHPRRQRALDPDLAPVPPPPPALAQQLLLVRRMRARRGHDVRRHPQLHAPAAARRRPDRRPANQRPHLVVQDRQRQVRRRPADRYRGRGQRVSSRKGRGRTYLAGRGDG